MVVVCRVSKLFYKRLFGKYLNRTLVYSLPLFYFLSYLCVFWIFCLIYLPVIAPSWVGRSLAFYLIGPIFRRISTDEHHHRREQELLVSGVEKINMTQEVSIVYLDLLPPTLAWISGRDPLLVVSVVMSGFFPKLDLPVILFLHHHDISIMHRMFLATKLFLLNPIFIFLKLSKNVLPRQSSPFSKN